MRIGMQLLGFALLLLMAFPAFAVNCSDAPYFGVIDGNVGYPAPSQIQIDQNCTFQNWPASNPLDTNISFYTQPGGNPDRWLVIFDNVVHTGQMSCNKVAGHVIWFVNGSSSSIQSGNCQNLLIPVEKIDKHVPEIAPGDPPIYQTTAAIGVPFTYTLKIPVLYDPGTQTVIEDSGSENTLHSIVLTDDLNATGVDLSVVGTPNVYWKSSGATVTGLTYTNVGGLLTFDFGSVVIPGGALPGGGDQIVIEITLVLNDNPLVNVPGTSFVNVSEWEFGRIIDGTEYAPLPGENGISEPLIIAAPNLVMTKTGPTTLGLTLNLGEWGNFALDVQNTGLTDAWNVTIQDQFPDDATGGMCDTTPEILNAQIFAADGTTPISPPLVQGTDYLLSYAGVPTCELTFTLLTAAGAIGPSERLIISYRTKLDPDTQDGATLTNVAGATEWFNDNDSNSSRVTFTRTLTNGTPTVVDHEDEHTVTAALFGYFFEKSVANLTTGVNPTTTALPGNTLRYTLRLQATDVALSGVTFQDDLGVLNPSVVFEPGSLQVVAASLPPLAVDNSNPAGGTNGAGLLDISNLNVPANSAIQIQFDIRVDLGVADGTVILNQADLISGGTKIADSDDPNINGQADPSVPGDEDPTRVVVTATPPPPIKQALQPSATIGEQFTYRITVGPYPAPLFDVRIQDNLAASGADLRFVSLTKVSGPGTPENIGTAANLIIAEDATSGIDIPPNTPLAIDVTVELLNTSTNVRPLSFNNTATFTYNQVNDDNATSQSGGTSGVASMTVIEPVVTMTKAVNNVTPGKALTDPAAGGDILEYVLTIPNTGDSIAHDVNVTDILPPELSLVAGSATAQINSSNVIGFNPTPTTIAPNTLVWGRANGDNTLDIPVGGNLVLTYRVTVQDIAAPSIANSAWVDWTSLDGSYPVVPAPGRERTGEGCGIGTVTPPNTYCFGPETATVATLDTNAIAKAVTNDTWDSGLSTDVDQIVRVGDIITYQLTLTLREGQTRNVSIQDALDPGLAFVDVVSINGDTTAPYSSAGVFTYADIPAGNVPVADQTGTLTWTLGDIVNAVDNNPSNNDLVIVYRARVLHGPTEPPPPTPTATTLNNQATLGYTYADGVTPVPLDPARMQSSANVEARQPAITSISKTGTVLGPPVTGTGTQADPYVVDITANSMDFSIQACNTTGQAPAYGVVITDQLAPELEETTVSTPVVTINGAPATAGVDYTYTPPAGPGGTLTFQLLTPEGVNPGQCVTVSYTVGFDPLVPPNQLWSNNATVGEYWSLPPNTAREYIAITPVTPAMVWMTNNTNLAPPTKVLSSPASGEATVGEQVVYQITVPGAAVNAALSNVVVTDTLHPSLEYVSATAAILGGGAVALTDNTTGNNVNLGIAQIQANQQVVITLTARVANNNDANAGVSFTNTASYTFDDGLGGPTLPGGSGTSTALTIVEPQLAINKGVANVTNPGNPPTAGDVLRYTLTFPASAGANFSDAFDLGITDNLSLGLAYQAGTATVDGGNTIADPVVVGDGVTIAQTLTWDLASATANIDVPEGATVTVTYDVLVLNGVAANQNLVNSATVQWTSLNGASVNERTGVGCPTITPPNDYCAGPATTTVTTPDNTTLAKVFVSDTSPLGDPNVRVGDLIEYELRIGLQEGQHQNLVLTDTLPQGLAFVATVSINGDATAPYSAVAPFAHADIAAASVSGNPATGPTTVTWNLGDVVNAADGNPSNDTFVIRYRAQVLDEVHPQVNSITLTNNAQLTYTTVTGNAQRTASTGITLLQPDLSVSKSAAPAGGDPVIGVGELVTYTVDITNNGAAPAYDVVLQDIIPVGLRNGAATITMVSISRVTPPNPPVALPNLNPTYNAVTGIATWNFDTGVADVYTIPAGDTLRVVYQVQADNNLSAGMTLINQAQVQLYYSFDDEAVPSLAVVDDREVYGPTNTATTTLTTGTPVLIFQKVGVNVTTGQNPAVTASPGDMVRYELRIVNTSALPVSNFSLIDELDRLNTPPVFASGSLVIVSALPPGATDNSDPNGGTNNTGLVNISGLTLAASDGAPGGPDELSVQYRVTLLPVITNGIVVLDQAQILGAGPPAINSDDPNVNGADNPNVLGDEDPTRIVITSAPIFQVQKTSQDLTGDPALLFAGDTLRYTITVKNIGTENAVNVVLQDAVPANTTYVANSTTLNGAPVPDTGGTTALQTGILIHAPPPEDQTPGVMRADSDPAANNVATIVFDVTINAGVPDSTVISNQGFVNGTSAGGTTLPVQPSDDPATAAVDDPTLDIVIQPNGIVYDAVSRQPLAGVTLTMQRRPSPGAAPVDLDPGCFVDPAQQGQVTTADGSYKFELNFSLPECPPNADYIIAVTAVPAGYEIAASQLLPPNSSAATPAYSVPLCPADAIAATSHCEAQALDTVPTGAAPTTYYLHLTLDNTQVPQDSQIFNNHIPIDPEFAGAIRITKTTPLFNVTRAGQVPYTITVENTLAGALQNLSVVDTMPPGFKYVKGSGRINGVAVEPVANGSQLTWGNLTLAANEKQTIQLLLVVGSGVSEGEYVNSAQAFDSVGSGSNVATATVRVVPDPTFDCTDVIGKVFDDANLNGYQDKGEKGLSGVRVVSARGLLAKTDEYGRFHITCAVVPNETRGSNFILKLDDRTLPTGYRLTTENPLVHRATRGKAIKFNFGATLHRVVRLDVADGVFEPNSTEVRPQWAARFDVLLEELRKSPSLLRISYLADVEDQAIVKARVRAVKRDVAKRWAKLNCCYQLTIETEIFWRRGGPPAGKTAPPAAQTNAPATSGKSVSVATGVTESAMLGAAVERDVGLSGPRAGKTTPPAAQTNAPATSGKSVSVATGVTESAMLGAAVERHAESDVARTQWVRDEESEAQGDKVEVRQAAVTETNTIKLQNVVPPIRFASGKAEIPEGYTEKLRDILNGMKDRTNVRLHLVGHTDNVPLAGEVKEKYGDNRELSRERAGTVAEYFQQALNLPPESISYEGVGDTQPVASNDTEKGKALNRRVEVEVWYDEISEKLVDKEVVVAQELNRVKVCRVETVCKLRYKEGHAKRARIKNLIAPLHFDDETTSIPPEFLQNLQQALINLKNKQGVVVKFIGYTDNLPLTGRAERIYGTHEGLSKARARRASLAVQDALRLPTSALEVTGKGAAMPLASNETEKGRALNRRIEVEFWYDDALQELPDEPQICPEAAGAETVTRVYDPPSGAIPPILYDQGKPVIPEGYVQRLKEVIGEIHDRTNVRLRFIGYTNNERLERRTALLYGDDVGLSTARARRTMDLMKQQLGLSDGQAEFEGHGYVQSNDVVNTGFIESDTARVEVQVVYDELAVLDDDSLEVTRLTREVKAKDPLALNLMRITVDGKPLNDPGKSISDIERCTDVALEKANVQFQFDNLELKPRLNVTAWPIVIRYQDDPDTEYVENLMRFRMYTNYPALIDRAEVRIFESEQSERDAPLDVIDVDKNGYAKWQPSFDDFNGPSRELKYVLRVYDKRGRFDETKAQPVRIINTVPTDVQDRDVQKELLVGYGETRIATENIKKKGGAIKVQGSGIPGKHSVWVAGQEVPVSEDGRFVSETILPPGTHTVEVAVLDAAGNGELFLRDLELKKNDWFYVGIADVTASIDNTNGPGSLVTADNPDYDDGSNVDGRLAFYTKGKFGDGWQLTSSVDTLEGPIEDTFNNFLDKSPGALFRRIDPDYFYPTYGDDSTVEQDAPTLGKFYAKLSKNDSYGLWGNFKINYTENDLAHVERGLYGANGHYQSSKTTSFGEHRLILDGFAADPGTVATRDEFLGTGGSLYYLPHQDILTGSERARIEIRDKDSGIVIAVKNLTPVLDYDIDYLQGRIVLSQPLPGTANDNLLVASDSVLGNPVFLVVYYEFTPGFTSFSDLDTMATGGRIHYWFNDHIKVGLTSSQNEEGNIDSNLNATDLTLRKSAESWLKLEVSKTEGPGTATLFSPDGGFSFDTVNLGDENVSAGAYQVEGSVGLGDFFDRAKGKITFYARSRDAGYSAPGLTTLTDTQQHGGSLDMPVGKKVSVKAKVDKVEREQGPDTTAAEVDIGYQLTEHWNLGSGIRYDDRTDDSPIVPLTQVQGERTDVAVRATYDSKGRWTAYGYVQGTVQKTGDREDNQRVGSGGSFRVTDRLKLNGEVSAGDLGPDGRIGVEYLYSDRTNIYLNYEIEDERTDNGLRARKGNLISGFRTRYSDSTSVYVEDKYQHGDVPTGLMHSTGINYAPTDRWSLGAKADFGTLTDNLTGAEIKRSAFGVHLSYGFKAVKFATALEYGKDEAEEASDASVSDRTTWLLKNSLKWQVNPNWRILGKLNYSNSTSSKGEFFDGSYTEAVLGYGYRPIESDRLNLLFKYTYFYNLPSPAQETVFNVPTAGQVSGTSPSADVVQKSHIAAVDVMYDLTRRWQIGGKYAYRLGQISLDRVNPEFFDSSAQLFIARADWQFKRRWDLLMEGRVLDVPDAQDRRSGALFAVYWHMNDHLKLGFGYNFTDFSDDLTDLNYDSQGVFINVLGTM